MGTVDLLALVLLAVGADVILIGWSRRAWKPDDSSPQVRLLGMYSPILTWLKYRRLPRLNQSLPLAGAIGPKPLPFPTFPINLRLPAIRLKWLARLRLRVRSGIWLEITLIGLVALAYSFPLLEFDPNLTPPGNEYQAHVGAMSLFNQWLAEQTDFPLWNPIVGHGRSLIADPFLFVFNPFISAPMALLGVVDGSKVALALNFFIAGLGAWALGRALGFKWPARLWSSLLYMLSGALSAHLNIGQLQLVFALGWLPWSVAGLLWVIRQRTWRSLAAAAVVQALFFFAGNFYYQAYTLVCLLLIGCVYAIDWKTLRVQLDVVRRVALLGLITLGLIAIQFLPQIALRSSIRNTGGFMPGETQFFGSQQPEYAMLNYIISDREFTGSTMLQRAPFLQESYRYIGVSPLLLLLLLVPAFQPGRRRAILAFALCFLIMLAWASVRYSFFQDIYRAVPFLYQFRWPGRALSVGALFLIFLGGYGLDELWTRLRSIRSALTLTSGQGIPLIALPVRMMLAGLLLVGVFLSLRTVYTANAEFIYLDRVTPPESSVGLGWLRAYDPGAYAVWTTYAVTTSRAIEAYERQLRLLNITDGWVPADPDPQVRLPVIVELQPKYRLIWEVEELDVPGAELLKQIATLQVWRTPGDFPYAFLAPLEQFSETSERVALDPEAVTPADSVWREGANRVVVDAEVDRASVLVISESWFDGWRVSVDRQPAELLAADHVLAVELSPGRHTVVFEYDPPAFKLGLIGSGLTLLFISAMIVREKRQTRRMEPTALRTAETPRSE
ncbi:MAG TPA: hypothetical protein VJG32_04635 [Anaerolineae bacterium]|nr:hypothetical protein [Anaerolineae bacterium]